MADNKLSHEIFGSSSIVVRCENVETLLSATQKLEGQLTTTIQMDPADIGVAQRLLPMLEEKSGRIIVNGWPTGVEVADAMVHGGPFPATSDSRTTSVGSLAIERFFASCLLSKLSARSSSIVLAKSRFSFFAVIRQAGLGLFNGSPGADPTQILAAVCFAEMRPH